MTGSQEVEGSNPFFSTQKVHNAHVIINDKSNSELISKILVNELRRNSLSIEQQKVVCKVIKDLETTGMTAI